MKENNLAYDLSTFDDSVTQEVKIVKVKRKVYSMPVGKVIAYAMMFVIMLSMLIYGRVSQLEVDSEYRAVTKTLQGLNDEYNNLYIKLESKLSLNNIQNVAVNELGLTKISDQQIEYIKFDAPNVIELKKSPTIWDKFLNFIK